MTTNYAEAHYNEIYDLGTSDGSLTILGIHTPTGNKPRQMLGGFFDQFRKFLYKGCDITLVPCAQLPADPLGVGYEAGELQLDPREMVNPIIFKGCHADSLNKALDTIFANNINHIGQSIDGETFSMNNAEMEECYYAALSDASFKKFGIQQGAKIRGLHPLVHDAALTRVLLPNDLSVNEGRISDAGAITDPTIKVRNPKDASGWISSNTTMFTNGTKRLKWLPTRSFYPGSQSRPDGSSCYSYLPRLFMGVLVLPPSYKIEQYFRLVITHHFAFKDFGTATTGPFYSPSYRTAYVNGIPQPSATKSLQEMVLGIDDENTIETNGSINLVASGVH
nr:MAG: capsid protein [ssDNA virus sp.]